MSEKSSVQARINKNGYWFCLPFMIIFLIFNCWPTIYTLLLGFGDLEGLRSSFKFIGFANYNKLIHDANFWKSVGNTFILWGLNFIPQLGIALIMAIWLTDVKLKLKGKGLFRAVFYMPNLLTAASIAILFRSLFGYPVGPVNQFLMNFAGFEEAYNFFRSPTASRLIVSFIQWWMWCGQTLILFMAAITSIPPSLYEAATIDGASNWHCTWKITIPMLRPMMFYMLVTSMVGGMQMFDIPFLLTDMRGGPDYSIRTIAVYMYNVAFQGNNNYSYAAAISVGMFIITVALAFFINQITKEHTPKAHGRASK